MKIKDLPKKIKELVLKRQEEQGIIKNEELDLYINTTFWGAKTVERMGSWNKICYGDFDVFYEKYPKKISDYPKVMWVSEDEDFRYKQKRVVFMEKSGSFIAWNRAETIEESELSMDIASWRYAKDIEILTVTKQQIADKFGVDINDLIIE